VTTRQRVFGLGLLWLAGVWIVAGVSGSILPGMTAGSPWTYDVARRVTPLARWDSGWYVNLAAASPLAGFGLFCLYFWRRFSDPFLFVKAQHNWSGQTKSILDGPSLIWKGVVEDLQGGRILGDAHARTLEGLYLLVFLVLAAALFRQRRRAEALYVVLTVAIVFTSGTFESAGRYVLPAFPAFAALAGLARRPGLFRSLLVLSGLAEAAYVWAFVHWYWAG
jgi:hypothetical protein